jgi:hypothetical protein
MLVRTAMQSPNYAAGTTGWRIARDGSVEFNNGTFRGSLSAGTSPGQHFIVNNSSTGDPLDIYDSSNRLIFSIDGSGRLTSYSPGSVGDPYIRLTSGIEQFNNASGFTTTDPPSVSAPSITTSGTELQLYSGTPDGGLWSSVLTLFGGTSAAGAEARVNQRGVTGDVVQTDTSNNDRQLVHAATYSGTVSGGDGHWVFAHGCLFTPKVAILTPYAAGGGDGAGYVRMWTNPLDGTFCYTIWTNDGGSRTADGTTVGVHALFFG